MRGFRVFLAIVGILILASCHSLDRTRESGDHEIVLVTPNLDDDDGDGSPDAADQTINGLDDRVDLTCVELPILLSECVPAIKGPGASEIQDTGARPGILDPQFLIPNS